MDWKKAEESSSSDIVEKGNGKAKKIIFRHKSRTEARTIHVNYTGKDGKQHKKSVTIDQKQMVYYSEKYAKERLHKNDVISL